jgi:hypothetical protein
VFEVQNEEHDVLNEHSTPIYPVSVEGLRETLSVLVIDQMRTDQPSQHVKHIQNAEMPV